MKLFLLLRRRRFVMMTIASSLSPGPVAAATRSISNNIRRQKGKKERERAE